MYLAIVGDILGIQERMKAGRLNILCMVRLGSSFTFTYEKDQEMFKKLKLKLDAAITWKYKPH